MRLKENIKELRIMKKLNQKELAQKLEITPKTISHWETGYTEPSVLQLIQLADFFEVTLDDLVGRDE